MKDQPFSAEQFTPTRFDSAADKAKWANAMARWAQKGFPEQGFTKNLYYHLYQHMYGHIAHYNQWGFFGEWFANDQKCLSWLLHAAKSQAYGDPAHTWSDVALAFTAWVKQSGLIELYQQKVDQAKEAQERAQLAYLQQKYNTKGA